MKGYYMIDIDINLINDKGDYDLSISLGDFALDSTLKTPFLTSLYTDLRFNESGHENSSGDPQKSIKKGGYWANALKILPQGSLLWNYSKARRNGQTAESIKRTCKESLIWLNKNIEINYRLTEDSIVLNYRIPGNEKEFNFEERF